MDQVIEATPAGRVREGLARARRMLHRGAAQVAYELGNGAAVTAGDTVPFTIWVAARHLADYPGAVRTCITAGGDIDTTSAIAGGIVSAYTGTSGIPDAWLTSREPLPEWVPATSAWRHPEGSPDSV